MRLNLEDNCTFINGGSWTASEYADSGYPVLKVSNFDKATISYNDLSYLQESSFDKYKKNQLKLHDIVIATVGSHPSLVNSAAGRCITVPKDAVGLLLNQNALCLRSKNEDVINQRYLGYLCKSQLFQHFIQQRGKGAANQMRIPIGGIKSFDMDFPEIETQRKIASILYAYDDLIENNLKRIKLLEEQAQQTYEEWFVRFKFPGYENVAFDELSGLPVGWEKVKLNQILKFNQGVQVPIDDQLPDSNSDRVRFIRIVDVTQGNQPKRYIQRPRETQIVDRKDLFMVRYGAPQVVTNFDGAIANNFFKINIIDENKVYPKYIYSFLNREEIKDYLMGVSVSATMPAISFKSFGQIEIKLPDKGLQFKFHKYVDSIFDLILNLQNQNQHLKEARDMLLPRLMSGMIDVESLEVNEGLGMVAEESEKYKKV